MNVIDLLNEVKDTENPYQEAMARDPMFWIKFVRRHKAGVIDALFLDRDRDIKEEDIKNTVDLVAEFFELPMPEIQERAETIAEVITSENADECQLYYDWQEMEKSGINNREALKLSFLHEMAHQYLYQTRFLLFENELWIQELAADLLVGGFSVLNGDVATGKYKYVVSRQKATLTHPDGKLREEVVVYGRKYVEQLLQRKCYQGIKDILTGLPAFVYSHYQELQESWDRVSLEDSTKEPEPPAERKPIDYESLPDTNLLKQYWLEHKDDKKDGGREMNVMDNSPIDVPSVGHIVAEALEVEQLQDCHLYVLPSNAGNIGFKANEVFQMLMEKMGSSMLLNNYKLELLSNDLKLDNHPKLMQAIKDDLSNIVMPLSTPSKSDKQYLIVHSEEKDLITHIPLMIYTSERVSKYSVAEQIKMLATEQPDEMRAFIRENLNTDAFLKRYVTGMASNMMHPTFGMAMSKSALKGKIGINGKITHQDKLKMMENVEENFVKARRDEKLDAQITLLIQSMDAEDIKQFVYSLNKKQQSKFFQMLNTKRTGEAADAWLEVRYEGKIESDSRTKGRYRLYVNKGEKAELVDFSNSDSFLIHLLYIIEKVIKDDVNTLDFNKYKDLFVKLSWEVYRFCDGEKRFEKIVKGRDADGNSKERRLSDCLGDIKNSVSTSCKKLGVLPSPYYIENADEHLYVSKKDIFLPEELIEVINKWKNTI